MLNISNHFVFAIKKHRYCWLVLRIGNDWVTLLVLIKCRSRKSWLKLKFNLRFPNYCDLFLSLSTHKTFTVMKISKIFVTILLGLMRTLVVLSLAQKPRLRAYRGLQTQGYMPLTISTARGFGKRTNSQLSKTM